MLKYAGDPITPRAAIYGGRVECIAPYMKLSPELIQQGYRGADLDFVSMYSSVQKSIAFPAKAHPKIYQNFEIENMGYGWGLSEVRQYFGIFSVFVTLPNNLYFSPLPFRCPNKKVLYPLCKACALEENCDNCFHALDSERGLFLIISKRPYVHWCTFKAWLLC